MNANGTYDVSANERQAQDSVEGTIYLNENNINSTTIKCHICSTLFTHVHFCISSMWYQYYQCLWIVHSWLPLLFSLMCTNIFLLAALAFHNVRYLQFLEWQYFFPSYLQSFRVDIDTLLYIIFFFYYLIVNVYLFIK